VPSILDLQDLYNEALVRELIEKTKSRALSWSALGNTQFKSVDTQESECVDPAAANISWEFTITKSQVGNVSYKYILDVKKDNVSQVTLQDGPLSHTNRDSLTKQLYEIVEILTLGLDAKIKNAVRFVQNLEGPGE
jgi:hypothetical protein